MTEAQHKGYNEFLNFLVAEASPQNPKNRNSPDPRVPINYVHLRESDRFYKVPNHLRQQLHPALHQLLGNKSTAVRVTTDQKTGKAKAAIIKGKVADLHIVFPQCDLDCRISVNVEVDWTHPIDELEEMNQAGGRDSKADRHKDRLSYKQGNYRVDLTQVTQTEPGPNHTTHHVKVHELEIELDAGAVIEQGGRAMRGEPHNYDFLVEGFVNNIRMLARKARDLVPPA
ncbi:mRNA-capping enzyme subunit beta [Diaporthe australafricana]|uniref:mRNA-capping enzyme subunit beta n=1 Tax=Diaporthe australafricana TaxID=127596 RepID=A0ABR3W0M8_9PEZI